MSRIPEYALIAIGIALGPILAHAQEHLVPFETDAAGDASKSISGWGFDVTWPSRDNTTRSLRYMGSDQVDFVRVGFRADRALVNNELPAATKADLDEMASVALLAGADKPWTLMPATESGVHSSFKSGSQVVPSKWVQLMEKSKAYYNHTFVSVEPFNEPDYGWGQGTTQNLVDICDLLSKSSAFSGITLVGGSTLNSDNANTWYYPIRDYIGQATTHTLAGSFTSYVDFLNTVKGHGKDPVNPEAHNVAEVIVGAEYGMKAAMWWAAAELARGSFVKACQGERLGYAEDRPNWTAAAVYRAPSGAVQAFVGASERMAKTTTYRFVSKDRDVFFDGHGPQREYTVTIPGGNGYQVNQPNAEKLVNITWGEDIQPAIDGRYIVVNRTSGKVMEVAGGSSGDGANIQQGTYTGKTYQQWDIESLDSRYGGDYSYFAIKATHSGKSPSVSDWSLASDANLIQWGSDGQGSLNQVWYLEYVEDGYFRIRNRWSDMCLDVPTASDAAGADIRQTTPSNSSSQQWRLIPVGAAVEFDPPAAPTGLNATANAASVSLSWNANGESDLDGYNLYRANAEDGPFELIARSLNSTAYTDGAARAGAAAYYKLKAIDKSLNRSDGSAIVAATPTGGNALVARYDFEGNESDVAGNGNNAELSGTVGYASGKTGSSAIALNGADAFARLPATISQFDELTIAAWVEWAGGAADQRLLEFGDGGSSFLRLTPTASAAGLQFVATDGVSETVLDAPALEMEKWTHVAVTLGDGVAALYVDGALVDSAETGLTPAGIGPVLNYLGRGQLATAPFFAGKLDDVRIYNYALRTDQVAVAAGLLSIAQAWRVAHFQTAENAGDAADDADPDKDRVPNYLERAFSGNPKVADRGLLPVLDETSPLLSITYRKAIEADDLEFAVQERSGVATDWIPAVGQSQVIEDDGVVQRIRFLRPMGDDREVFLRVVVGPK